MLFEIAFPQGTLAAHTWELVALSTLAALLCAGLFTPVASAISGVIELVALRDLTGINLAHQIFAILVTLSVWILGPGAFSLDARIFGRRVIFPSSE
jgi:uncharacterized membrane protein YphA (DoxX/SURF4 family)